MCVHPRRALLEFSRSRDFFASSFSLREFFFWATTVAVKHGDLTTLFNEIYPYIFVQ
jgi:hypothetical protein